MSNITTTIVIVPGLSNTTLPGDHDISAVRNILSAQAPGLENMNVTDAIVGNTRTITFSQRTGTKGALAFAA